MQKVSLHPKNRNNQQHKKTRGASLSHLKAGYTRELKLSFDQNIVKKLSFYFSKIFFRIFK